MTSRTRRPRRQPHRLTRSQRLGDWALSLFFAVIAFAVLTHA